MSKALLIFSLITFLSLNVTYAGGGIPECEPTVKREIQYLPSEITYIPIEIPVKFEVTRKNRLSLLIGSGPSENLNINIVNPITTQLTRPNKQLWGAQYQRDYKRLTFGVMYINNDSVLGSVGINW